MIYNPRGKCPFLLTTTETRVLALLDQGLDRNEIRKALGLKGKGSLGWMITNAREKQRLALLDDRRPAAASSLSKARGVTRMAGTK